MHEGLLETTMYVSDDSLTLFYPANELGRDVRECLLEIAEFRSRYPQMPDDVLAFDQPLSSGVVNSDEGISREEAASAMTRQGVKELVALRVAFSDDVERVALVPVGELEDETIVAGQVESDHGALSDIGCWQRVPCLLVLLYAAGYGGVELAKVLGHLGRTILMGG